MDLWQAVTAGRMIINNMTITTSDCDSSTGELFLIVDLSQWLPLHYATCYIYLAVVIFFVLSFRMRSNLVSPIRVDLGVEGLNHREAQDGLPSRNW